MAATKQNLEPDHTAVRVALWRALHVQVDPAPHVLADEIGMRLVGDENWRSRPDMSLGFSRGMRASAVGRARFIEDLVVDQASQGVVQYVILGAGLDSFAQRRPEIAAEVHVFEVDQPGPQAWKRRRLAELALPIPENLHFVPVDFEAGQSWGDQAIAAGFDRAKPAVVVSTGVSMYLTKAANLGLLRQAAALAPGSTFATTFMLSLDLLDANEREIMEFVMVKAQEAGTPFLSLFSPQAIVAMAKDAGFKQAKRVSADELCERYFAGRADGLNAGAAENFLVAAT
jgi:methyltransferase (TIGR00027 family)